jgi:uncharacterized protein involved in exopolysaccharide biosynthesis
MNSSVGPAHPVTTAGEDADDFDFAELGRFIWRGKRLLTAITALGLALALVYLALAARKYTAVVVLAPAQEMSGGNLGGALSQFAGAASMLGVSLPQASGSGEFPKFQELLTSTRVAGALIASCDPRAKMFPGKYDRENGQFTGGLMNGALGNVYRTFFGLPPGHEPDAWDVSRYLGKEIGLELEAKTGLLKVSFTHRDPVFAVNLLNQMVSSTDSLLKADRRAVAIQKIAYFNEKLKNVTMAENRAALIALLTEEEKVMSVIEIKAPYAAKILIPAQASSDPTQPNIPLVLALGFVGGLITALAFQTWRFVNSA